MLGGGFLVQIICPLKIGWGLENLDFRDEPRLLSSLCSCRKTTIYILRYKAMAVFS